MDYILIMKMVPGSKRYCVEGAGGKLDLGCGLWRRREEGGEEGGGEVAENRMLSVMTVLQPSLSRRVNK